VDTFFWYWQLSTLCDLDCLDWLVSGCLWHILDLLDDFVALEDFTENDVFAVKVTVRMISIELCSWNWLAYPGVEVVMKN
jgi:hypothetical protein